MSEALRAAGVGVSAVGLTITVSAPHAPEDFTDTIVLGTGSDGLLYWFWSWDQPIAPAVDVDAITRRVAQVIRVVEDAKAFETLGAGDAEATIPGNDTAHHVPAAMSAGARGPSWVNEYGAHSNSGPGYWRDGSDARG